MAPIDYEYDELTSDIPVNRLLKAALIRCVDMPGVSDESRSLSRRLLLDFVDVSWDATPQVLHLHLDERTRHYAQALTTARLLLERVGIEAGEGRHVGEALLFDMNVVVERFILQVLRDVLPEYFVDEQAADRPLYMDKNRRVRLFPDFMLWQGLRPVFVGDVKYKLVDEARGARRADLYQSLAYATAADVKTALLLYVGTGSDAALNVARSQKQILVRAVDLDLPTHELERRIALIAAEALAA